MQQIIFLRPSLCLGQWTRVIDLCIMIQLTVWIWILHETRTHFKNRHSYVTLTHFGHIFSYETLTHFEVHILSLNATRTHFEESFFYGTLNHLKIFTRMGL